MSSPAACLMIVSAMAATACRIRAAVGLAVLLCWCSGGTLGRLAGAVSRDRRRTPAVTVHTRTPSVSRDVRPSRCSGSLPNSGALWRRLVRRWTRRATREALREPHPASCQDRRVCPPLVTHACQPHRWRRAVLVSSGRARWGRGERRCSITRFARFPAPRPRPTSWGVCSTGVAQATPSHPSTRGAVRTQSIASTSGASSVLGRFPRPLGGLRAVRGVSAWRRRCANPLACWWACLGERRTTTRSRPALAPPGTPPVRAHAEPSAARPWGPRSVVRPLRAHAPPSLCVTPAVLQAALASAVAPVTGHGDTDPSCCLARDARVSNARLVPSPTNRRPVVCNPRRIRSRSGRSQPSSARAPDRPAVDSGSPKGSTDPLMPVSGGRVGSSFLWPPGQSPPAGTSGAPETVVASQRLTA
jgi:hypothetical protein